MGAIVKGKRVFQFIWIVLTLLDLLICLQLAIRV